MRTLAVVTALGITLPVNLPTPDTASLFPVDAVSSPESETRRDGRTPQAMLSDTPADEQAPDVQVDTSPAAPASDEQAPDVQVDTPPAAPASDDPAPTEAAETTHAAPGPESAPPVSREELCSTLLRSAQAHDLPITFFGNLIWQESRFDSKAVSPVGAQGVAQFMPKVATEVGVSNPFNPFEALPAAARMLRGLFRQFGNFGLAAAAYNAGARRVDDWLSKGGKLPEETRNYVRVITGRPADEWRGPKPKLAAFKLPPRMPCRHMDEFAQADEAARVEEAAFIAEQERLQAAERARVAAAAHAKSSRHGKKHEPSKPEAKTAATVATKAATKPDTKIATKASPNANAAASHAKSNNHGKKHEPSKPEAKTAATVATKAATRPDTKIATKASPNAKQSKGKSQPTRVAVVIKPQAGKTAAPTPATAKPRNRKVADAGR